MKIGIIIGSLGFGGAERVTVRLAEWWTAHNHQVSIYTTMAKPEKEYVISTKIKRFECNNQSTKLFAMRSLRTAVRLDEPNVVLIMDTPMCVYAVPALLGLGIPFIVSERSNPNTNAIKKTTKFASHAFMSFADGFVFQTTGAKQYYNKKIQNRSAIIANPLDLDALPNPFGGQRSKRVVAVGRHIPAKNYPLLIEAFERFAVSHEDYFLEVYGDGPERVGLEQMVSKSLAMPQIHIMGVHDDVLQKINDAAIYVLSSDLEGMPNALVEAMALGIPSIATDCPSGGPRELICNRENGLLVPVNNSESLYSAMNLLVEDKSLREHISDNAVHVREQLDVNIIGKKWIEYFEEVMSSVES